MTIITFTDTSQMPFGIRKGTKLIDVPAEYLLFLWDKDGFNRTTPLGRYIHSNLSTLRAQAKLKR